MTQAGDPITELERIAAAHWGAPEQEYLGGWLLRAAGGFTGRANSALPLGDPGMPLAEAVTAVTAWYRARALPPMIAVPQPLQAAASPLEAHLAERKWVPRPGPAFVMTARITDIPPPSLAVRLAPEPDDAWCTLYRYRGNPLPPIARTLLMSAPWQSFATIRPADAPQPATSASEKGVRGPRAPSGGVPGPTDPHDADGGHRPSGAAGGDVSRDGASVDGEAIAVGRVSVDGDWAGITAVEVDAACRRRGLGVAITCALCAAAAQQGATRVFLQVETDNAPARALYTRLGFRDSHRYRYLLPPP
jgi:N-acetylglutamate synthase